MHDKKYEIGVVISTVSLVQQLKKIAKEQGRNIHTSYQGLDEAIDDGKKMEADGVEVIISRRGTAHMLRENLSIPVLSLPQASIDIVKSLKKASKLGNKIVLTSFRNKIAGVEILEELLAIEIIQSLYEDIASMENAILFAKSQGGDVAVGGGLTVRVAEKFSLKSVEFETHEHNLYETFENALSIAQANREEQKKAYHYRCIIDATTEGVIAVDNDGRINTINKAARKFLGIQSHEIISQPISQHVISKPVWNKIEKINGEPFVFNYLPVKMNKEIIGGVWTIKDITNVMKAENAVRRSLSKGLTAKYCIEDLIHESAVMRDIVNRSRQFAKTDSTILIMGDTGTGKEILAQSVHNLSGRAGNPFVSVHCGALPEQLLESELFGYEEGAFTGSKKGGNPGRFEIAHKGTIFLDEIDTTPSSVQTRLLRVLQEQEVMRLGADRKIPIDVRIVAAASKDLGLSVQEGRFREDLFFRLNVLRIFLPPLKNRMEDIPGLLDHFIRKLSNKHGLDPVVLSHSYIQKLMEYSWPGNVRQLRNFVERLVLNCNLRCSTDTLDELYEELIQYPPQNQNVLPALNVEPLKGQIKAKMVDQESLIIKKALFNAKFSKTKAARDLGISRATLYRKLKKATIQD